GWVLSIAAIVAVLGVCGAVWVGSPAGVTLSFAVASLALALVPPLALTILGQAVSGANRVQAISRTWAIAKTAYVFGPVLVGVVSDAAGPAVAFLACSFAMLLIPAASVPLIRPKG
ncbi:MAG: hypothetical protein AAFX90_22355, partial [Pseudomonadota bacterium]